METTLAPAEECQLAAKVRLTFKVVVAYEDFKTAIEAKKASHYFLRQAGSRVRFDQSMWKFNLLQHQKLKEMAAHDAAAADLVIIALNGNRDLPEEVKLWTSLWLEYRGPQSTAMIVVSDAREESGGVRSYLREVAQRGKMDFIAASDHSSEMECDLSY